MTWHPHTRHYFAQAAVALVILCVLGGVAGVLVVRSGWFREQVRQSIVTQVETATGGRVELGSFAFDWSNLTASVAPFVLHGKEAASAAPLVRIDSIVLGLHVLSLLERKVDLATLRLDRPRVHILFYADGTNNLPSPGKPGRAGMPWDQALLNLKVRRYDVNGGVVDIDIRQVPLDFHGEDLRLQLSYQAADARYRGEVASRRVRISAGGLPPTETDLSAAFILQRDHIDFSRLSFAVGQSRADLVGSLRNLQLPRGAFTVKASAAVRDVLGIFDLPLESTGTATYDGNATISFADGFDYIFDGRASARGLDYTSGRLQLRGVSASAALHFDRDRLTLRGIQSEALGAQLIGQAELLHFKNFHLEGNYSGLDVHQVARVITEQPLPWNGTLAGVISANAVVGERSASVRTAATVIPATEGNSIRGEVDLSYDQKMDILSFANTRVATAATSLTLSGTLGQTLRVDARAMNLDDVLPALSLFSENAPKTLPLKLNGGEATAIGTVSGPLANPEFHGQVAASKLTVQGRTVDRVSGDVQASRRAIQVQGLSLDHNGTQVTGDATLTGSDGDFSDASVRARLAVRNADVAELARETGSTATALTGTASATVRASGTLLRPLADIAVDVTRPAAFGEQFDRLRANLRLTAQSLTFDSGEATLGSGKLLFSGTFIHAENEWKSGDLLGDINAEGVTLSRFAAMREWQPTAEARVDGKMSVRARLQQGNFTLSGVNGVASARNITYQGQVLGDGNLTAQTNAGEVSVHASAQVRESKIDGDGAWRLEGDAPGTGTLHFSRVSIGTLHDLVMLTGTAAERAQKPPFEGFIQGGVTIALALRKPAEFRAEATLDTFQANPSAAQLSRLETPAQDLQVRNSRPIVVTITAKEARIRAAVFTARDTNLEASGVVPFTSNGGADLAVRGTVNLAILQLLNADLLARGGATVNATIRGSLRNPQLNGRMELSKSSFYMKDVPNGVDNVSGVVLFDRNRATLERLTAETGGGQLSFRGFVEFGQPLIYRLQADARQVRMRYPEDVSMTANAQLSLAGTSEASTLSGSVTLNRAAISQGVDLGRLLAQASKPTPATPNPTDYLRGMRFDVHVESAPTFELETSLTRNVQTEVDLRLRGMPLNPALLGTVTVNSGEIQVFGNRYTVNRGDIRFLNPVRIEPTLDLNLETRTRGILVNVSVAGSPQKLNVNYSSDPPLQSREIIALLAVGRDPTSNAAGSQGVANASAFGEAGGILGQAVSQQLSNRLQRFFGASRVKIDPTLTGIDNLPSARLTLEQQVSRDITLTYITNLNRTQEQIVRVQWDLNRQWSAVAVRNSNGLFGVDIQFRQSFK